MGTPENISLSSNETLKYLGESSKVKDFFALLPGSVESANNREQLTELMPTIVSELASLESSFGENQYGFVGVMEPILMSLGVSRHIPLGTDPDSNTAAEWVLADTLPSKEQAKLSLRLVAAQAQLYDHPECIDLLDWLDHGVKNKVVVIPMGHKIVRVRHIGNVNFGDAQRAMRTFEYEQLAPYMIDAEKPFAGSTLVVIEDYNDLVYELNPSNAGQDPSDGWAIDAATNPTGRGYRVDGRHHIAIGTFGDTAALTEFMVNPNHSDDRFQWLRDNMEIAFTGGATETQKRLGRLEIAYKKALEIVYV